MDLLTAAEEEFDQRTRELRFNIGLLAQRLTAAADRLTDASLDRSTARCRSSPSMPAPGPPLP